MESMETKIILSLFVPGLLVLLFARVTYRHTVGLALTVALIAAAVKAGFTHTWLLYTINAFSLTAGYFAAAHMGKRFKKADFQDS